MRIHVMFSVSKILLLKQRISVARIMSSMTKYAPGFSSNKCIFLYASFVETSSVGNTNVPLLCILEQKTSHEHIHHYNIKHLQYIPVNTSLLELCHLTLRSKVDDPQAITKGLAVITCHFGPFIEMDNRKNTFACPDIDYYVATLGPRQLGHGMNYYRGRSSMSGYGLGNWFAKLFHCALPLAKKYTAPVATDFISPTLHD